MANIDFYILEETSRQKSLHFACHLVEKAYQNQQKIYIHTPSKDEAERLDLLLWTFRDDSFLPHNLYRPDDDYPPAIQIGFAGNFPSHQNTLLNLSQDVPDFYGQFNRVIEIVFSEPHVQQLARERYRRYRDEGHELLTHKIKAGDV